MLYIDTSLFVKWTWIANMIYNTTSNWISNSLSCNSSLYRGSNPHRKIMNQILKIIFCWPLGKSYLIQNPVWVNFRPKRSKINPILVRFGSYWMLISMVKISFGHYLHKNGHRNQMMALSCLKTSFLGSENQFFRCFEKKFRLQFFFYFFAELQIWQKLI